MPAPDAAQREAAHNLEVMKRLREVEQAIDARAPETDIEPSLDQIRAVMDLLGDPQRTYPVIHLTGTNGKTSTTRIIDALLLRPLPVAHPEQLQALTRTGFGFDGKFDVFYAWAYPSFRLMSDAVRGQAELLALGFVERVDITYSSDEEMEKANVQYVSGRMFPSFGLRPVLGRLFSGAEDNMARPQPLPRCVGSTAR